MQGRKGFSRMARGKTDEEKATLSAEWYGTELPGWLTKLEACVVGLSGVGATHAVGGPAAWGTDSTLPPQPSAAVWVVPQLSSLASWGWLRS